MYSKNDGIVIYHIWRYAVTESIIKAYKEFIINNYMLIPHIYSHIKISPPVLTVYFENNFNI